jgi:succinyl-diaminopimelate desuccinylase
MNTGEEILSITTDLMEFETVKGEEREFEKAFEYIESYFCDTDLELDEHIYNGKKTLVARNNENPEIMLHGHVDVVEADEELFEPRMEDGKLYGRGSADMKSGLASLMKLTKEYSESDASLGLMIVSDEEIGGFDGAEKMITEEFYSPEFGISAEPNNTEGDLKIINQQKGVIRLKLTADGKNAHGSTPWNGENAAEKLWKGYEKFKSNFEGSEENWGTTLNLGKFQSGQAFNIVPDEAEAFIDIRWTENYPPEQIREDLERIDEVEYSIEAVDPALNTDSENEYVQLIQEKSESVLGEKVMLERKPPASDMRHFMKEDIPAVVFGPEGYNVHENEEYLVIDSLEDYYSVMDNFVSSLESD